MSNGRIAVYPGSFDPIHAGHLDIIQRCSGLFDELIVAVLSNDAKHPAFSVAERVEMVNEQLVGFDNCRAESFSGLLVDFMRKVGARVAVRGLRAVSDFEYEFQMALMNRRLHHEMETFFLTTKEEFSYLSSNLVKEVFSFGGDLTGLAPAEVLTRLAAHKLQKTEQS